jgi:hypothetical protein
MKKLDIIQFTPLIGGETTLVKAMYKLLGEMGYSVRVIHPSKSGKKLKDWVTFEGQNFIKLDDFQKTVEDTDYLFFVNSIHLKKFKKTEDRVEAFKQVLPIFSFENKKVIFYEHGRHSSDLYDYPAIFERLKALNNRIVVFTNTRDVQPYYDKLGYESFVIRQPFDPTYYPELKNSHSSEKVNICFNSRYTANKRPQNVLPFFKKYLGVDSPFVLNFRGNVRDNCSVWYDLFHYFEDPKIVMNGYAEKFHEIYESQDYCLYGGYTTKSEKGKMEYAMLESFYYGIPLIVEKEVIESFRFDEYGISKEQFLKSVICLTESNLDSIINRTFDWKAYAENAKSIVNDFLPEATKSRLAIGLSAFDRKPEEIKKVSAEPLF